MRPSSLYWLLAPMLATAIACDPSEEDLPSENAASNNSATANNQTTPTNNATTPANNQTSPTNNQTTPGNNATTPRMDAPDGAVTYHADIRPVMDRACVNCHAAGGIGPFTLDYKAEEWETGSAWWGSIAVSSVSSGEMPPWMPAEDCRPLQGKRVLTPEEITLFEKWAEDGYWEGKVEDYEAPMIEEEAPAERRSPDIELTLPEAYTPSTETVDDYRCFILDHEFDEDTFIIGSDVIPDQRDIVHHVILYMIPPGDVSSVRGRDNRDEGAGYECFGDPGSSLAQNVAGWVPGAVSGPLSENSAIVVPAGAKLVAQMHYNTVNIGAEEDPPSDQTRSLLWTLPAGQTPEFEIRVVPLANIRIEIEAGDPESSHVKEYKFPYDAQLIGTTPHMHTLGKSMKLEKLEDGGEPMCLVDIPRWDFNWQQSYRLTSEMTVPIKRGDILRQTCGYDNSPANQQMIGGEPRTPETVFWGDGTFDEMCLTYAVVALPYSGSAGIDCSITDDCFAECQEDDPDCMIECALSTSSDCTLCAFDEIFSCAGPKCANQGIALQVCERNCENRSGESIHCIQEECAPEWAEFYDCAINKFQDGACEVGVCGD